VCWKQNLRVIWVAELVAMIGFTGISPILPLYVSTLGVLSDREVRLYSGLVFLVSGLAMALFSPIWGALSDHYGRKLNIERAVFSGAVLMTLTGLVQNVYQLLIIRMLQGVFTGTVTAATTFVASAAPRKRSGQALGMLQTVIYAGATAGLLLGGVVADAFGYRVSFFVTGALLFLTGVIVLMSADEPPEGSICCLPSTERSGRGARSIGDRLRMHLLPVFGSRALTGVLSIALSVRMAARLAGSTLPLLVRSIAGPGARVATVTGLISAGTSGCGRWAAFGWEDWEIATVTASFFKSSWYWHSPSTCLRLS
jgi:DHA1 family multidrug resistance protein-like MFS transporter